MTNDTKAPERIWASYIRTQDGMWIGKHAAQDAPYKGATGYIRHDLHLSLVATAYKDAGDVCTSTIKDYDVMDATGTKYLPVATQKAAKGMVAIAREDIRSLTPADAQAALEARDKQESKLAKALEALEGLMMHMPDYVDTIWIEARATLAELKGNTDDT